MGLNPFEAIPFYIMTLSSIMGRRSTSKIISDASGRANRARKINTLHVMHAPLYWEEANVVADTVGELWHKSLCRDAEACC